MPICQIRLRAKKPASQAYPKELRTIGDHIRKRRLDLNLYQKDVAKILGVDKCTVFNWEKHKNDPQISYMPKIIKFLGYIPFDTSAKSEGERILIYRSFNGISQKDMAQKLGINKTIISD